MAVDSLVDVSLRACCKIHKRIRDIGGLPYNVARPFLLKIDNPEQLHALETKCDQIVGHDAEIWLALIKRDIPNWETKKHEPKDPKNWWKVYRKLKQDSLLEMDAGADKLRIALNDKNEKHLAEIKPMEALARSRGARVQAKVTYGYQSGKTGSRGGSKLGVLERIKQEAQNAKAARTIAEQQLRRRMATTVTRAPAQFVEDVRTQRQKGQHSPERVIRAPRPPLAIRRPEVSPTSFSRTASSPLGRPAGAASLSSPAVTQRQFQDREARLRALTSGNPFPAGSQTSGPSKEGSVRKEGPILSLEDLSTPKPEAKILSASFLEEPSPPSGRKLLGDALNRPGEGISRSASPQIAPMVRKRKKEPDLFMAPVKRQAVDVSGNSVVR